MDFTPEQLPDTLTIEQEGKQIPLREAPFVKEAKDLPALIQRGYEAHREVGARVRVPGKDAKPEDVAAFKQKVYEAGVFSPGPASPADYKIAKPEGLPDGIAWNEERAGQLATVLHKYGVPVEAAGELLKLHQDAMGATQEFFKTDMDKGMAALRAEHGDKYDERASLAGRLAASVFKTPEELALFNATGLGNHPGFLSVLMRLAPLAEADSSFFAEKGTGDGGQTGEDVRSEVAKIMSDKTHPMHEGYRRGDPKVQQHIDDLYRKAYGTAPVEIGAGGITVTGRPS